MSDHARVDVHHHVLPPDYVATLARKGTGDAGGRRFPAWSAEQAITLMDAQSIASAIVSVSAPGAHFGDDAEATAIARDVNEFTAQLVRDHPGRFGFFATLTLPDVEGAIRAAAHALDDLGADGVVVLANSRGTYLGDPAFDPLMAELDRRGAIVFVHPEQLPGPAVPGIPPFIADFLLDTTRAGYNLVRHDVPRRFPNLKFILSHAGGFLPYASHRLGLSIVEQTGRTAADVFDDLSSFYFDTALSATPATLPSLLAFAKPGHVLFGSDWPFASEAYVAYFAKGLDSYAGLDDHQRDQIDHASAAELFPRLAGSRSGLPA
jgi:predicted TIM-barrel fold metal-dependent hydrolase